MTSSTAVRVIVNGTTAQGERWSLRVGGDDDNYWTGFEIEDHAGSVSSGGMAGPKLCVDDRLNVWTGGNPDRRLIVRCDPDITQLVLTMDDGTRADVTPCMEVVVDGQHIAMTHVPPDTRLREVVGLAEDGTVVERFDRHGHDLVGWSAMRVLADGSGGRDCGDAPRLAQPVGPV